MQDYSDSRLTLDVRVGYQVVSVPREGGWQINRTGYRFAFSLERGPELLAYHWHPEPGQRVPYPHVHLEAGSEIGFPKLQKAHLPTGIVDLHEIVRFAVEGLGVAPLRDDWREIIEREPLRVFYGSP